MLHVLSALDHACVGAGDVVLFKEGLDLFLGSGWVHVGDEDADHVWKKERYAMLETYIYIIEIQFTIMLVWILNWDLCLIHSQVNPCEWIYNIHRQVR